MKWQDWSNIVLGLAVVVVAFLGLESTALMVTLAVLGVGIAAISFTAYWDIGEPKMA